MRRREFIGSALALAAMPAIRVVGEEIGAVVPLKVGILGGTHSHGLAKAKALLASTDWNVVGIHEPDEKVRGRYEELGLKAVSQEELLEQSEVIVIESEVKDHYRHAKIALSAEKHVHLEKPPAETLAEFQELQILSVANKKLMQMGYMWRFNPGINAALEAAAKGYLGAVYLVRAEINKLVIREERGEWNMRGGTMFELGCHVIDPVVRLLGRPENVTTHLKTSGGENDRITDNTVAVFDYPTATAIVTSSILHPGGARHRHLHLYGSNGTALVKPIEQPVLEIEVDRDAGPYKKGRQIIKFPKYERYTPEFKELAACIREKRSLGITPENDLLVQQTLLRACGVAEPGTN